MTGCIALVVGQPPSPGSVVHDVCAAVQRAGVRVTVTPDVAVAADLLVVKDLDAAALHDVEARAVACLDRPLAVLRSLDKAAVVDRLARSGVPVPRTVVVDDWADVRAAAAAGPVVVKPRTGTQGEGVLLLDGPAPVPPGRGPWLVQERIDGDRVDRKLYVVGGQVRGVLRTWPSPAGRPGTPFVPDYALVALARAAADALQLSLCGVDLVVGADRAVVVDVNAFPGLKGVPGAGSAVAEHLLRRLAAPEVTACVR